MLDGFLLAWVLVAQPLAAGPELAPTVVPAVVPAAARSRAAPVEITSDRFEVLGRKNQAVWYGHVRAVRASTTLTCEQLAAFYDVGSQDIRRLECLGGAEVTDGTRFARGDRADFDNLAGTVELTGSPEAREGPNRMRGSKVVVDLPKNTLTVDEPVTVFQTVGQAPSRSPLAASPGEPVQISAARFKLQGSDRQALWEGKVKAVHGKATLTCDRLVARYGEDGRVHKVECVGNVQAVEGDKWARGRRAEYLPGQGKLFVTGAPEARQGPNHLRGTRVTLDLFQDTLRVDNAVTVIDAGRQP